MIYPAISTKRRAWKLHVFSFSNSRYFRHGSLECPGHTFQYLTNIFLFRTDRSLLVFLTDLFQELSRGHTTNGSYDLQLRSSFVDIRDTCITNPNVQSGNPS